MIICGGVRIRLFCVLIRDVFLRPPGEVALGRPGGGRAGGPVFLITPLSLAKISSWPWEAAQDE
jgi:hypothetical protein